MDDVEQAGRTASKMQSFPAATFGHALLSHIVCSITPRVSGRSVTFGGQEILHEARKVLRCLRFVQLPNGENEDDTVKNVIYAVLLRTGFVVAVQAHKFDSMRFSRRATYCIPVLDEYVAQLASTPNDGRYADLCRALGQQQPTIDGRRPVSSRLMMDLAPPLPPSAAFGDCDEPMSMDWDVAAFFRKKSSDDDSESSSISSLDVPVPTLAQDFDLLESDAQDRIRQYALQRLLSYLDLGNLESILSSWTETDETLRDYYEPERAATAAEDDENRLIRRLRNCLDHTALVDFVAVQLDFPMSVVTMLDLVVRQNGAHKPLIPRDHMVLFTKIYERFQLESSQRDRLFECLQYYLLILSRRRRYRLKAIVEFIAELGRKDVLANRQFDAPVANDALHHYLHDLLISDSGASSSMSFPLRAFSAPAEQCAPAVASDRLIRALVAYPRQAFAIPNDCEEDLRTYVQDHDRPVTVHTPWRRASAATDLMNANIESFIVNNVPNQYQAQFRAALTRHGDTSKQYTLVTLIKFNVDIRGGSLPESEKVQRLQLFAAHHPLVSELAQYTFA